MKTKLIAAALMLLTSSAFANPYFLNSSGAVLGAPAQVNCSTGLTCSMTPYGVLTMTSSPTLADAFTFANGEIMNNTLDDTIEFLSEDNNTTLQITGFEAKTANLNLYADQGDDAADKFSLNVSTSDVFSVGNNGSAIFSLSSAGVVSYADAETLTNASDIVTFGFPSAAANVKLNAFEATNANLTLQADESDDNGDDWMLSSVASDDSFTISNDTSGSQVAKLTMSTAGAITLVGGVAGDGGDAVVGFLKSRVTVTTSATLTIAQCGATVINSNASIVTLPEASTAIGCQYTFITANASNFDVNPSDGTDQILILTNAGGDAIRNATVGNSITLEALANDSWAPVGKEQGTWTDVN